MAERMEFSMRDLKEQMENHLEGLMEDVMERMTDKVGRLIRNSNIQPRGKKAAVINEAFPSNRPMNNGRRENHMNHQMGRGQEGGHGDLYPARYQRLLATQGGKFPLPKNPKVEIPVFKGAEDVLS